MGNQLAEERRHRAARYEAGSIISHRRPLLPVSTVLLPVRVAVIAGTRKPWTILQRHSTPSGKIDGAWELKSCRLRRRLSRDIA